MSASGSKNRLLQLRQPLRKLQVGQFIGAVLVKPGEKLLQTIGELLAYFFTRREDVVPLVAEDFRNKGRLDLFNGVF